MATIGSVALDGQNDACRDSGGTPGRPFGAGHRVPGPDLPDRLTQPGRREVGGPAGTAPRGSSAPPGTKPGSPGLSRPTRFGMRSSPRRKGAECRDVTCRKPPRMPIPGPPGRARGSLGRPATSIVAAYVAGAAR